MADFAQSRTLPVLLSPGFFLSEHPQLLHLVVFISLVIPHIPMEKTLAISYLCFKNIH